MWITDGKGAAAASELSRPDAALIKQLQAAHDHIAACGDNPLGRLDHLSLHMVPTNPYDRNLARLAFLAPDIQALILEGRQPPSLNLARLPEGGLPAAWDDQRRLFEIPC